VGDYVYYFLKATDANSQSAILANNSNTTSGKLTTLDTSKGTFFYKVLDRTAQPVLTIRDVQYTPFIAGVSPYMGGVDSVGGIITADTASLLKASLSGYGTNVYYMQSGNQPFSGVWVVGPDSIMQKVANGDSVIVKGSISEYYDVTEIYAVSSMRVISKGNTLPTPLKFKTEQFGPSVANGTLNAEPYEGMLVRFDSVTVTSVDPVYQDPSQFEISNSSAPILVERDGKAKVYNSVVDTTIPGVKVLRVGTKIASVTGILFYGNNRYKLVPRTDADYGTITGVAIMRENLIPDSYTLSQNYPNPFNPATTIKYALPVGGNVTLKVYNGLGQEIETLVNMTQQAGTYTVSFDASKYASGMYLYRISAGSFAQVKKMMLVK
jgi:predicted extracellular nuclease